MSQHPRKILTPGASKKRKERETHYPFKLPATATAPSPAQAVANTKTEIGSKAVSGEPIWPNRLLAGYLAHEFLTKGTLFGQKYDPARTQAVALAGSSKPERRQREAPSGKQKRKEGEGEEEHKSYAEVASILTRDGAHIPGIVNPTQLAKWIQM